MSPNPHPIAMKFGMLYIPMSSHAEHQIKWLDNWFRKNWEKPIEEECFFRSNFLPPLCPKEWRLTTELTCSQVVVQIYQVYEPQKNFDTVTRHNKKLSILKELWQRSQKRSNHIVPGFCNILTGKAHATFEVHELVELPQSWKICTFRGRCEHLKQQSG